MSKPQTPAEPAGAPAEGGSSRASSRFSQRSKIAAELEPIGVSGSKPPSRPRSSSSKQSKPSSPANRESETSRSPVDLNPQVVASPAPPSRPRSGISRPGSGGKLPPLDQSGEFPPDGEMQTRAESGRSPKPPVSKPGSASSIRAQSTGRVRDTDGK